MAAADHVVGDLDYGSATLSSGRVTVLPDNEGGTSATDEVGTNGPTTSTSNGSTIATFAGSQHLSWPMQASVNGLTSVQGFAFWIRPHSITPPGSGYFEPFSAWLDTSDQRFNITQFGSTLMVYGGPADPTWVRNVASFYAANTWVFVYVHFDGTESGEDRLTVMSVDTDGAVTDHSHTVDTGTISATLPSVTGNLLIGAYETDDTDSLDGDMGQHVWALDGLLTEQELLELAGIDAPVVLGLATGTPSVAATTASGTASVAVALEASGTPSITAVTATGAALTERDASGTPSIAAVTATGAAARVKPVAAVVGDLDAAFTTLNTSRVVTLVDAEGGSSATASVGNGPTVGTSNSQETLVFAGSQHLLWPLQAGVNNRTTPQGYLLWVRPSSLPFQQLTVAWTPDASAPRFTWTLAGSQVELWVSVTGFSDIRVGFVSGLLAVDTWTCLYWQFDGGGATDALKCRLFSVDEAGTRTEHTLTYIDGVGTPGSMPTALAQPTGDQTIGAANDSGGSGFNGSLGRHIYALDANLSLADIFTLAQLHSPVDITRAASGAPSTAAVTASGTAAGPAAVDASGTPSVAAATAAGTASHAGVANASGTPSIAAITAAGTADVPVNADGAASIATAEASGTATAVAATDASGSPAVAAVTATGAAQTERDAQGAGTVPAATASGDAVLIRTASGSPSTAAAAATGAAVRGAAVHAQLTATTTLRATATASTALRATATASTALRSQVTATTTRGD